MLELIINKEKDLENIILVENGKLLEFYTNDEKSEKRRLEGNIYAARVVDIINGMQAAFIDFGSEKNGFIHLKDAIDQIDETQEKREEILDIRKILKPKQPILVQVKKDSDEKKGARVSTHISLPGKFIVLMPNTTITTISQKISDANKKEELLKLIKENLPKNTGAIIRTSAIKASYDEILQDMKQLLHKWHNIEAEFKQKPNKLRLICEGENISEKIILDLSKKNLEKITTNSEEEYKKFKKMFENEPKNNITISLEKENLLEKYDLFKQIEKIQNRKIWLNCGGFITIDKTEALTAIDVNTGKFTGKNDLESTIFKVNKEATIEIAKQLRLRDIGGIIIIDYIDMQSKENKQKIEDLLKESLKEDRAKTQVEGFTKLNLMELTRKHICSHLN